MRDKLYKLIANKLAAIENCEESGNWDWKDRHIEVIRVLVKEHMPSGSGFDSGTELDFERSKPERLVFSTSYHHMDQHGGYDGWTHHLVSARPSLYLDFVLRIDGRDRNRFKDYAYQVFSTALQQEVEG